MDKSPELLKIKDVAEMLGVSRRTVYRRIWTGELPAAKIGGLYYIKRKDLEDLLEPGSVSGSLTVSLSPSDQGSVARKCGSCLRLLKTPDQVSGTCEESGCEIPICQECAAQGDAHCRAHGKTTGAKLAQAQAALAEGSIPLLVDGGGARLAEVNYLNRISGRLAHIDTLLHPQTGEAITIQDWESLRTQGDQRAKVLRTQGKILLDSQEAAKTPMNAWLLYRIPEIEKTQQAPLDIFIQVLSRVEVMARDGFDTQPLSDHDLRPYLLSLNEEMAAQAPFRIAVLAGTTGWDGSARALIQGNASGQPATAFVHENMLIYLYDLVSDEIIFNQQDGRPAQYATLFTPLLLAEEAESAQAAIRDALLESGHSSLTLIHACKILPYPEHVIHEAFKKLDASRHYRLVELDDLGIAIQEVSSQL